MTSLDLQQVVAQAMSDSSSEASPPSTPPSVVAPSTSPSPAPSSHSAEAPTLFRHVHQRWLDQLPHARQYPKPQLRRQSQNQPCLHPWHLPTRHRHRLMILMGLHLPHRSLHRQHVPQPLVPPLVPRLVPRLVPLQHHQIHLAHHLMRRVRYSTLLISGHWRST